MADGVRVTAADYVKLQAAIKELTDKKLAASLRKRLREAAYPIGRHVLEKGGNQMPRRGGLAERVRRNTVTVSQTKSGAFVWAGKRGVDRSQIARMNRGLFRHPVWADTLNKTREQWAWVNQTVPAGAFTAALDSLPPDVERKFYQVLQDITKEMQI